MHDATGALTWVTAMGFFGSLCLLDFSGPKWRVALRMAGIVALLGIVVAAWFAWLTGV